MLRSENGRERMASIEENSISICDFPEDVLAEIIKWLDWRIRVRCEMVCSRFRDVCVRVCKPLSYPWMDWQSGLWVDFYINGTECCMTLNQRDKPARKFQFPHLTQDGLVDLLQWILSRWAPHITNLLINGAKIGQDALQLLCDQSQPIYVNLHRCRLVNTPADFLARRIPDLRRLGILDGLNLTGRTCVTGFGHYSPML